ncbi:hypothetical protein CLOSTMETH_00085 [[Clostridium] methylpentosum DSM 5476]|uniref:Uncharacterized protein n=1 Tax=[Clostridium] methylpentosum DSM 5476 TaxID=537013 RepID=C0E8E0_9FIRM|nr:hypothetical protein CLOSTMETH_00085 [[Clostridium] methylpentosum DSM 5476]
MAGNAGWQMHAPPCGSTETIWEFTAVATALTEYLHLAAAHRPIDVKFLCIQLEFRVICDTIKIKQF